MKLAQYLENLDPELAGKLETAVNAVREEFEEKLTGAVQTAVDEAAAEAAEAAERAAELAAAEAASRVPDAAPKPAFSLEASDELRMAALDIDVATSQAEILEALSRGVLRFASRVAIFVNRGDDTHGWSSSGFGATDTRIKEVVLASATFFPAGTDPKEGSVALNSAECAPICDALGADQPSMGLVMPFVLGSQVVGTVYCDRMGDEPFLVSAMQLVTYMAGQTLETLPVRKRASTATLSLAGSSMGVAESAEGHVAPVAPESQTEPEPEPETVVEEAPHIEPAPDLESPSPEDLAALTEDPTAAAPAPPTVSDYSTDASGTVELPQTHPSETYGEPKADLSTPATEIAAEPTTARPSEDEEATRPGFATPASATPAGPAESAVELGSTAVTPPDDLEGPGWAFTTPTAATEGGSESDHEEAQRLARLLVTEIKLYNEEAVEEGRRGSNIYSRLREDIDRSRQIFEDRIDESVRTENDYFKKALVRILAGGDSALLGS